MRTHLLFPSLLLLGSLSLTAACSSGSSGTSDASTAGVRPEPSPGTGPVQPVDPSKIKGLRIVNAGSEDSSCPFAAGYPDVPGAQAMTAAMKKDVDGRLATFRSACDDGGGAGNVGELNISHQFLVASGDVLGVRLTTQDGSAAGSGLSVRTYWYDGKAGAYRTALGLIGGGSRDAFVSALKKQLKGRDGTDADTMDAAFTDPSSLAAVLDDMAFTADGGLRVTFDRGDIGAPAAGSYVVTLSRATVTPWLSAFGKRAQQQTVRPSGSLDLGAAATPTPAVPTHTASGDDDTDCKRVRCVALTFDDGPAAQETATLLTYLAQYRARATFFTVGQNVAAHPDLVRAEARAGNEVGNHSWSHPDLTKLTAEQVTYQLNRTSAAIKAATGKAPTLFRPPYGAVNDTVRHATKLSPVLWTLDTEDWKYPDAAKVAQSVVGKVKPNDVVLMHDIHATSVAAIPEILRTLSARGYHFVTVSHLRATM
ncbi:xylanase/chitin deacetylase [Streptomyces lincolnensis]|uniref:Xylanase/chitin deacetylase n=1 Tax=Streptomyces lincolnensis TaxID=1915 RepID=A0A1B1MMV6_STRLN|nr:polysaccharide deacetylase family protein [Streptomyces lincolnensis]ANS69722.1 xylanase/chitin deacetylase [Streptomyces lincolnensis]AXG58641.1 xylanase/chitin deacetylase [Streptomyces lincolnensis]QMV11269.1 polysaccharide deacetylase family protein [Streptomyces lincolnensis]